MFVTADYSPYAEVLYVAFLFVGPLVYNEVNIKRHKQQHRIIKPWTSAWPIIFSLDLQNEDVLRGSPH